MLAQPSARPVPAAGQVERAVAEALSQLGALGPGTAPDGQLSGLRAATGTLSDLSSTLQGVPGLTCLIGDSVAADALQRGVGQVQALVAGFEAALDAGDVALGTDRLEEVNATLVRLHDAIWSLGSDRLNAARSVSSLAASLGLLADDVRPGPAALAVLWAVHVAFSSLDRLEVRGRDSAGLHLMLAGHGLDLASPELQALVGARATSPLFGSLAVRAREGCLSIVYKAAAEIGELGDNVAALRLALRTDPLLARALASPDVRGTVVAHTRWASVGLISPANAHPLNSDEVGDRAPGPYVIGALNGDVDNYPELLALENVTFPAAVTTDAKIIPTLVSRYLGAGGDMTEAFRRAVERMEGSVGIVANAAGFPDELLLALRGSGQSLNIGLAEDAFVVASEPYGLVEETARYLRMNGEGGGQVVRCRRPGAGTLAGLQRWRYDGTELPISEDEVKTAEITTRDVDRRGFKHFLLKEISESPLSVRKTLRGKLVPGENNSLVVRLGDDVIPPALRRDLSAGRVHLVLVVGQGTAAVAGQAVAAAIARALPTVVVRAMPGTELSGWGLSGSGMPDDMSSVLVVAISQSGTTTDTNRTVDLVRGRGPMWWPLSTAVTATWSRKPTACSTPRTAATSR